MIGIIDCGLGNIASIKNMLKKIGCENVKAITASEMLFEVEKIILPGVGAFDAGMKLLNNSGMREVLDHLIKNKNILKKVICN